MTDASLQTPPTLDAVALARWQGRAPANSPWLHEEVGRRMQERLDWIVQQPEKWCDWEPMRGGAAAHELVAKRYANAQSWIVQDQPAHMAAAKLRWQAAFWSRLAGRKATQFGRPEAGSMDMLWANMALHHSANPPGLMAQWAVLLRHEGFVMFSAFGPDTLLELRSLYQRLDWPPAAQEFTDMHDLGDMLQAQGFAQPIMDIEHIHLEYATPQRLLLELRELGRNLHPERFAGLRSRAWQRRLLEELGNLADSSGRISMRFEIVYGHAFKHARLPVAAQTSISLQDMRASLKKR